jgi:transporter family-2 protein
VNTLVAERAGSSAQANLAYFSVAFFCTVLYFLYRESPSQLLRWEGVPWWGLLTGIAGACGVLLSIYLIEELGPDRYFVAGVAGQVVVSIALAHFAWLGVEENALNWQKVVGALLSIGGVLLVAWGNAVSAE